MVSQGQGLWTEVWPCQRLKLGREEGTYGEHILHHDDQDSVANQVVPVADYDLDGLEKQLSSGEQEVETGHQVTHAEDVDPAGPSDEDEAQYKPEQVAENNHFQHV